jgi:hypothetical protein
MAEIGQVRTVAAHAKLALERAVEYCIVWLRTVTAGDSKQQRAKATAYRNFHPRAGCSMQVLPGQKNVTLGVSRKRLP